MQQLSASLQLSNHPLGAPRGHSFTHPFINDALQWWTYCGQGPAGRTQMNDLFIYSYTRLFNNDLLRSYSVWSTSPRNMWGESREARNSLYLFIIEVELIYNVVLLSAVQQSDSVIHTYTFIFISFSIMVYHRLLNIVPCAVQ